MWLFTEIPDSSLCIWRALTGLIGNRGLWQGVIGITPARKENSVLGRCSGVEMSWFYLLLRTDHMFYLLPKASDREHILYFKIESLIPFWVFD